MPNVALYNIAGQSIGELELKESIFGIEPNTSALHAVVKAYLANQRQGTQSALTRAEVRGGGIKIYRQSVNKKVKRLAMKSALSSKVSDGDIIVYDALDISAPKTKEMVKVLNAMNVKKALVVLPEKDEIVERATANIPGVKTTLVGTLNVYEILKYDTLILTKDAVAKIEEVYV